MRQKGFFISLTLLALGLAFTGCKIGFSDIDSAEERTSREILAGNVIYYVDAVNGNDANDGMSEATAWKTLVKVSSRTFYANDQILLMRGQTFVGICAPLGSGTTSGRITLGAYGIGARPIINAGTNLAAIRLVDQSYWNVQDIETTGGDPFGIFIGVSANNKIITDISVLRCYAHDIQGEGTANATYDKLKGGIIACAIYPYSATTGLSTSATSGCKINNLTVDGCVVANTFRWGGIMLACASWGGIESTRATNTLVQNCSVSNTYGDGIVILISSNSTIQNCVSANVGNDPILDVGTPSGIWMYTCSNSVVKNCEAYGTRSPEIDGGAFDLDIGSNNCKVEYNYGHDNQTYGVLIFAMREEWNRISINWANTNSIVRYNVFSNNGRGYTTTNFVEIGDFFIAAFDGGSINGLQIYNNTTFWNPVIPAPALMDNLTSREAAAIYSSTAKFFKNNIVYANSTNAKMMNIQSGLLACDNNIYYNTEAANPVFVYGGVSYTGFAAYRAASGQDANSYNADPLLTLPTYAGVGRPIGQFVPQSGSPAINTGANVGTMGTQDFLGTAIPQGIAYDIGACEYVGTVQVDTQAPSTPANLSAVVSSSTQINLAWTASTDNIGVSGYQIFRNGVLAGTSAVASYSDTGLTAATAYSYYVVAFDAALNYSAVSNTASATTLSGGVSTVMHVDNVWTTDSFGNPISVFTRSCTVYWKVRIYDSNGMPVSGASVVTKVYKPNGSLHVTKTGTTGTDGIVTFSQSYSTVATAGTYTIQVSGVSKTGYTYNPAANTVTQCSFVLN